MNKDWRPKDKPNQQEELRRKRLINENQAIYDIWRREYEKGILCTARAFVIGYGHITLVPMPKSKKKFVRD
jgi:hypothetical protein